MGIGGSLFLIALGAIIAFAVRVEISWLDLAVVGWVLMLAGITGLYLTFYFWNRRRRAVVLKRRSYRDRPPRYAGHGTRYETGTTTVEHDTRPTEPLPPTTR